MTERSAPWTSAPSAATRVSLVQVPRAAMAALMVGDPVGAAAVSGLDFPADLADGRMLGVWARRYHQTGDDPSSAEWVTRAVLADGVVIGAAGFHGPPDARGMVEVGYGVAEGQRRRGYAKAILAALIRQAAAEPAVTVLRATVSPDNTASLATVAAFGLVHVGEQWDEEDGRELIYELPTPAA
ncbi:GNAT family N-acetyltransferase [Kitasatospora sp. NPDC101801]|uniref:GNAT family N-acetyltransferase n=1 Tax=Kitasatospora sp. NPDC101801 TaxID=3364103 RepID=UPI00380E3552